MNRQSIRIVAGANLVAGCLLLQGCGMFGKKPSEPQTATIPEDNKAVVSQPVEPVAPAVPSVETSAELPPVQHTTSYTIQKGDTLSAVAYKYNLRWQDVVAVNPGLSPNKLRVGQVIQLPGQVDVSKARAVSTASHKKASAAKTTAPKASASVAAAATGPATTYVVKQGDSLSTIAHKHGVKIAAVREANALKGDKLSVGQKLKIPGATKKVADTAAPAAKKSASATAAKTTAPKAEAAAPAKTVETAPAAVTPPPAPAAAEAAPAAAPATPAAAPAAAPAAESNAQTYTVKEGEDLYAVAIRWGVSPSDLKALNNLTSTELKAGTVLKIPGAQ